MCLHRWKRDENNKQVLGSDDKPILQFVSVQRRDNGEWALPGVITASSMCTFIFYIPSNHFNALIGRVQTFSKSLPVLPIMGMVKTLYITGLQISTHPASKTTHQHYKTSRILTPSLNVDVKYYTYGFKRR